MLWTHVGPGPVAVDWSIARADTPSTPVRRGRALVERQPIDPSAPGGNPVMVEVDGLAPATEYRFWFEADGRCRVEGETRTLPAREDGDAVRSFRLGLASCARWPEGSFGLYRRLTGIEPDLMVHLGDYIYQDGDGGPRGPHEPPRPCRTALDYELRYRQYRADAALRELHERVPWIAIWDDHEFANDAWLLGSRQDDARSWGRRREAAAMAHARWLPQRAHGNGPTAVDRSLSLGSVADLIVIDTRMGGREAPQDEAGGPSPAPVHERRLLSDQQWEWLEAQIGGSTAPWLLIGTSVQFLPLRLAPVPKRQWPPWRWLINPDQWDGYPGERQRLLDLLVRYRRDGVVLLSGDLHARFHSRLQLGDGLLVHEITTPSITARSFARSVRHATVPVPGRILATWLRTLNPHIESLDLESHGATVLDISESTIQVRSLVEQAEDTTWTIRRSA